jgi:hypothetical protein
VHPFSYRDHPPVMVTAYLANHATHGKMASAMRCDTRKGQIQRLHPLVIHDELVGLELPVHERFVEHESSHQRREIAAEAVRRARQAVVGAHGHGQVAEGPGSHAAAAGAARQVVDCRGLCEVAYVLQVRPVAAEPVHLVEHGACGPGVLADGVERPVPVSTSSLHQCTNMGVGGS